MRDTEHFELLSVIDLWVKYDNFKVLTGADFSIEKGEIVCLAGKNGTGKSTLLKAIGGLLNVDMGRVTLQGEDITNKDTEAIVKMGVGMLLQDKVVFPRLRVKDHLQLAAGYNRNGKLSTENHNILNLFRKLDLNQLAGKLSGGERKQLGFAMLLVKGADKLWLLDEPSAGVAPNLVTEIMGLIKEMNQELGITVLMVEQNLNAAKKISTRIAVLENGRIHT